MASEPSQLPGDGDLPRVPVYGPLIEDDDVQAATDTLRAGWLGMGRDVDAFERAVGEVVGGERHVTAVSTGFAALHVAMMIAGVGPGDEVILPSIAHLADVQPILACGAEPVFCDVDAETMCLDPERVAELAGARTKAILALDYGCYLIDEAALSTIAKSVGARVVRDAAHAFGSFSDGRPVGSFSDLLMFSFDPVKSFTAIDCGMLVVANADDHRVAREIRWLGSDQPAEVMYKNARTWDYDATRLGYRYHVSNIHAALGLSQVGKLDRIRANRQAACRRYADNLKGIDAIWSPQISFDDLCPFTYFIRVAADRRDDLRATLAAQGIDTGLHWRPAHQHTYFQQFRRGPLPVTELAGTELITLPLHSAMPDAVVDRVSDALVAYFR